MVQQLLRRRVVPWLAPPLLALAVAPPAARGVAVSDTRPDLTSLPTAMTLLRDLSDLLDTGDDDPSQRQVATLGIRN